jgi:hypothetical protein
MSNMDLWSARSGSGFGDAKLDVVGYGVEATDGSIGKVDEATYDTGSSYIVVDTGPWIFGKKVLLPAGIVDRVDTDDENKDAPEFDESTYRDTDYRDRVGGHYGPGGRGYTA